MVSTNKKLSSKELVLDKNSSNPLDQKKPGFFLVSSFHGKDRGSNVSNTSSNIKKFLSESLI